MKTLTAILFLAFLLPAFAADAPAKLKLTSKEGQTIDVTVVSVGKSSAKIKKSDGKEFEIAFDRLQPESVEALKKAVPATPPATPAPDATKGGRPLPKGKPATPADLPEKVVVKPGEKVLVTFTEVESGLTKPVVVKEVEKGTPHFSVDFKVRKEGDKTSMATVAARFGKVLAVQCLARNKGQTKYYPTSIIPLGKLPCYESWGDDVEELVFYDFAWSEEKMEE